MSCAALISAQNGRLGFHDFFLSWGPLHCFSVLRPQHTSVAQHILHTGLKALPGRQTAFKAELGEFRPHSLSERLCLFDLSGVRDISFCALQGTGPLQQKRLNALENKDNAILFSCSCARYHSHSVNHLRIASVSKTVSSSGISFFEVDRPYIEPNVPFPIITARHHCI
jgi:hypothetical protein